MNEIKTIIDIFSKTSIKDIGVLFLNFTHLFTKPITTLRKIIGYRNGNSYDLFIVYVLYYSVFIYFYTNDLKKILPITILEIIVTLLPFFVLIIPLLFFRKIWKKKIKSNRLFRLIFVLKLQFIPLIVIPLLLIKWAKIETPYILIENIDFIFDIVLVSILPLLLRISILKKIIWIITNYIFQLTYIIFITFLSEKIPDIRQVFDKVEINTPSKEYVSFFNSFKDSDLYLIDDYYTIIASKKLNDKGLINLEPQFATYSVFKKLLEIDDNLATKRLEFYYSIKYNLNSSNDSFKKLKSNEKVEKSYLDSLRLSFNKRFYPDLKLCDSLRKNATFESNKSFFNDMYKYLKQFDSIYTDTTFIKQVFVKNPIVGNIYINEDKDILIFQMNHGTLKTKKNKIISIQNKLGKRAKLATITRRYFYFPLTLFSEDKPERENFFE